MSPFAPPRPPPPIKSSTQLCFFRKMMRIEASRKNLQSRPHEGMCDDLAPSHLRPTPINARSFKFPYPLKKIANFFNCLAEPARTHTLSLKENQSNCTLGKGAKGPSTSQLAIQRLTCNFAAIGQRRMRDYSKYES